jgi:hypothetical protein
VPEPLPRIRLNLDFMPSPAEDYPGLLIRDPYKYSDDVLVVPPPLIECLQCFDGAQTELDLRAALVRITGDLEVGEMADSLRATLSKAGFLEDEQYEALRAAGERAFAEAPLREPAHAGSAYPEDPDEMRAVMREWTQGAQATKDDGLCHGTEGAAPAGSNGNLFAIAAPHVSPSGGWESYRAAYSVLRPEHKERTFVILATSHYGEPETFGLTRKTFRTPLGDTASDTALVDFLERRGGKGVRMEN